MKATLTLTGETYADADISAAIVAACRAIDNRCNRRFYKDTSDTTRYYTPLRPDYLRIDDLADVTSVKVDQGGDGTFEETWVENTDFWFEPLNAETDGWPRTSIHVHPSSGSSFPSYRRSVQIVGKHGWDVVPGAVVEATTIMASRLLKRAREAPFGVASLGLDGAGVRVVRLDPDVELLIGPYARLTV